MPKHRITDYELEDMAPDPEQEDAIREAERIDYEHWMFLEEEEERIEKEDRELEERLDKIDSEYYSQYDYYNWDNDYV